MLEIVQSGLSKEKNGSNSPQVYCDLNFDGQTKELGRGTIPVLCTQTDLVPDLCVVWTNERKILIVELTVPFELNIEKAHTYKSNKYAPLVSDIESNQFEVTYLAIEVGSQRLHFIGKCRKAETNDFNLWQIMHSKTSTREISQIGNCIVVCYL